jgi:hypothetical protein
MKAFKDAKNERELAEALLNKLDRDIFFAMRRALSDRERKHAIEIIMRAIKYARREP